MAIQSDLIRYKRLVAEALGKAAQASNNVDREAWLKTAADWAALAQMLEREFRGPSET
jgi:hypothetical protein